MKLPAFLSKTDLITPRNFENRFVNICYGATTYKDIIGKLWVFYYAYHAVKHDKEFFSCVNKLLVTGSLMFEESKLLDSKLIDLKNGLESPDFDNVIASFTNTYDYDLLIDVIDENFLNKLHRAFLSAIRKDSKIPRIESLVSSDINQDYLYAELEFNFAKVKDCSGDIESKRKELDKWLLKTKTIMYNLNNVEVIRDKYVRDFFTITWDEFYKRRANENFVSHIVI